MQKISLPPGFDPRTVQPVASRCIDWTIAALHRILLLYEKLYENGSLVNYGLLVSDGLGKEAGLLAGDGNGTIIFMLLGNDYISGVINNY